MNRTFHAFLITAAALCSCSPKIVTTLDSALPPLSDQAEVTVLDIDDAVPDKAQELGTVRIGDTGWTLSKNGTYDKVLDIARTQAVTAGGNVLKITEHKYPDFTSSIHRLKATIYNVSDLTAITKNADAETESSHPDYAMLYLYRTSGMGGLINYNVSFNDREIFTATPKSKTEHKIYVPGYYELKARTETEVTNRLNIRLGQDYYVKCSVSTGILAGRPTFELMPLAQGKDEYNSISGNVSTKQDIHDVSHWRISAGIGYGHRQGRIPESDTETRNYLKSLKNGLSYNFDVCYYFSESLGAGLKHSVYSDSESVPGTVTYNDGTMESGTISDNIRISFTGPIMSLRNISANERHTFVLDYGLGYIAYNDKVVIPGTSYVIKGHDLGQFFELGYGIALNEHLSASLQLSLTSGVLTSYDLVNGNQTTHMTLEKENFESLNSISAGIGLSWSF